MQNNSNEQLKSADEKNLKRLEFNKILAVLASHCVSAPGKEKALSLRPFHTVGEVNIALNETDEALVFLLSKGNPPISGLTDISAAVSRAVVSAVLTTRELLDIARVIDVIRQIKEYGKWDKAESRSFETLSPYFTALNPPESLEREIHRIILGEDEISDNATPKLCSIRREILSKQEKIRTELAKMIHGSVASMLQDPVVTVKNGRFCLPVKAEYRSSFNGMVHDQSGSGSTLFMEPLAVVELNNKITELNLAEQQEIQQILADLSSRVAFHATELGADYSISVTLDFIFAKAKLALEMDAHKPAFAENGPIDLPKARHPLIEKSKVVPISLSLGNGFTSLVVTGPNTGGKTVTLKTLGLLCLMGQSGLYTPSAVGTKLRLLDHVFADIGDEQSIEQSLSTFSSHMVNIVEILNLVTDSSLVLFDELGAGTDPTEGAALAQSILEQLRLRCVLTAATTHYSELKLYALSTPYVENASCEFNVETLKPTYRLLIGVPGKSNAFAISKRLGLSDEIIQNAGALLEHNDIKFEEMMTDLEIKRHQAEEEQSRIEQLRRQLDALSKEQQEAAQKLEQKREAILEKAREEARALLRSAKSEADETISRINKLIQKGEKVDVRALEQERSAIREKVKKIDSEETQEVKTNTHKIKQVSLGDTVKINGFSQNFSVITKPDSKGHFMVQAGIMKMQTSLDQVIDLSDDEEEKRKKDKNVSVKTTGLGKSLSIRPEIDIRGKMVDEAIPIVEKYLDDAILASLDKVNVIHGKGTGALREGIHKYLRHNSRVKSFRLGAYGEGDAGVTVIELKK